MKTRADFQVQVSNLIEASVATKKAMLGDAQIVATIAKVCELLVNALSQWNKILLCGNGGSAVDAQHLAAELVGRFAFDRPALPALSLSMNTSCITAIGNDYGFNQVFIGRSNPWLVRATLSSGSLPPALRQMFSPPSRRPTKWGCRPSPCTAKHTV